MAKYCRYCGSSIDESNKFCSNCGANLAFDQSLDNPSINQPNSKINNSQNPTSNGMAISGFVISLVSLFCCCGLLSWLSLIFSIIGVVKAKDLENRGKGLAIAGIIISALTLLLLVMFITMIIMIDTPELLEI